MNFRFIVNLLKNQYHLFVTFTFADFLAKNNLEPVTEQKVNVVYVLQFLLHLCNLYFTIVKL